LGPDEVPVGEKGCLTRAMRNRPSEPEYRCASASAGPSSPSSKTASDGVISLRTAVSLENQPRRNEEHEGFFRSFFVLFVSYGDLQLRVRCGAICLIAMFVAPSDQETGASKQLAPHSRTSNCKPL
jgi:hypothetical protein